MKKGLLALLLLFGVAALARPDSITFTSPAGGEALVKGTLHAIKYDLAIKADQFQLCLFQNGTFVGYIMFYNNFHQTGYPPGAYVYQWQVGKVMMEDEVPFWAPVGSGYAICVGCWGSFPPPSGHSNAFSISYDFSLLAKRVERIGLLRLPEPGGCPECFNLDLSDLREVLVKSAEIFAVRLYDKGRLVADMGRIGQEQGFADKLQVKLSPEALAAVKGGEAFELRLLGGRDQLIHVHAVRLVLAGR